MTKILAALMFLFVQSVDAAVLPASGETAQWDTGVICLAGIAGKECDEYEADLTMWNINGEFCGLVNETTDQRSPDAWFRGRSGKEGILVRYVESFQYESGDYGWALIKVDKEHLSWTVLTGPGGS